MSPSYDCKVEIFSTTNSLFLYGLNSTPFPVMIAQFQSATSPGVFSSQPDCLYGKCPDVGICNTGPPDPRSCTVHSKYANCMSLIHHKLLEYI